MKKLLLLAMITVTLLFSCLGKEENETTITEGEQQETTTEKIPCFSIYPRNLGVRESASRDGTILFSVKFLETVYWTGNVETVGNYDWYEVTTEDGTQTGWTWEIYVPAEATLAVMIDDMIIYDEANLTSVSTKKINKYQILAITGTEGQFYEIRWVDGDNNYNHGFIKKKNVSMGESAEEDIQVLQLVNKAKEMMDNEDVAMELLNNAKTFSSSNFMQEIRDTIDLIENGPPVVGEFEIGHFVIVNKDKVNMRDEPTLESTELALLSIETGGLITDISEAKEDIPGIGEFYWYKISISETIEGWVFGAFLSIERP